MSLALDRINRTVWKRYNPNTLASSINNADGDVTVTLGPSTTEHVFSLGSSSLFDNRFSDGTTDHFRLNDVNSTDELFTITFNKPISTPLVRIKTVTRLTNTFSFRINDDASLDSGTLIGNVDIGGGLYRTKDNELIFDLRKSHASLLKQIKFTMGDAEGNNHHFHEILIFTYEGVPFEFNDSVLTTKAWNSSRYDGKQLQASEINRATVDDIGNNNRTPIIQNYSRNIYIGNNIVGMDLTNPEDISLLQFNEFSYAQTNFYLTINDDDRITINRLEEKNAGDPAKKIGFYQAFYDDFKEGTNCKIIMGDPTISDNTKPFYPIYFNGGQIQQLFKLFRPGTSTDNLHEFAHLSYATESRNFTYDISDLESGFPRAPQVNGLSTEIFNETLLNEFFTGSLAGGISFDPVAGPKVGAGNTVNQTQEVTTGNLQKLFESAEVYKNESNYKGDKRFFITFTYSGSNAPIRTIVSGSVPLTQNGVIKSTNLAELSTGEFQQHSKNEKKIKFTEKSRLHQNYLPFVHKNYLDGEIASNGVDGTVGSKATPALHKSGSIIFSKVDDSVPSLLLNLPKAQHLPDGIGNQPFVIIPSNIHPYIEDNLIYFLTRAGIDIGGNTSPIVELNENNRFLK